MQRYSWRRSTARPLTNYHYFRSPYGQAWKTTKSELHRISNGDLLCSSMGSCRRSFDATVQLKPLCGFLPGCCYLRSQTGQTAKSTKSELQLQSTLQRMSNGDPLCLFDTGPCRRSLDAGQQYAQLALAWAASRQVCFFQATRRGTSKQR